MSDDHPALGEPQREWAVEVTWVDWKRSGAKGPTSQYGAFKTEAGRYRFLDVQRRDREVAATRVMSRMAAYTQWGPETEPEPTSEEDREARLDRFYKENGLGGFR